MAKGFPCDSLDTVPVNCSFGPFLGNRQTKLRSAVDLTSVYEYNPVAVRIAAILFKHTRIITLRQQPELARESENSICYQSRNSTRLRCISYLAERPAVGSCALYQTRARTAQYLPLA